MTQRLCVYELLQLAHMCEAHQELLNDYLKC